MKKEHAYKVFVDIWRLISKYRFQKLDDTQWSSLASDGEKLLQRYKGTDVEYLYRWYPQYMNSWKKKSFFDRGNAIAS